VYTGYSELTDEQLAKFYQDKHTTFPDLYENQYILVPNVRGKVVGKYKVNASKQLKEISFSDVENAYVGTVSPRNVQQEFAFDLLQNPNTTLKFITGKFGSGKTMLMIVTALELIAKKQFQKIVWVRNNIEVKNSAPLGALPGELFDKLLPYAMPIADHVGGVDGLERLIVDNVLEIQHLGFIRGRDIKKSIIISSEAENLTKEHVQLLIGRVGEGSNLWLDGDLKQTDKEVFAKNSGLEIAIDKLKGNPLFGYVHLIKSERSPTAQLADLLD